MLSYIILIALALGIQAAPKPSRHNHQDIHLRRMERHKSHEHAASTDMRTVEPAHKAEDDAPNVMYATAMHLHSESRPEWVRKRF
jgi:hypothetical protein